MPLFEDVQYSFEQKRLTLGDVYEIKDRAGNLVCCVRGEETTAKGMKVASIATEMPVISDIPGLKIAFNQAKKYLPTKLVFQTPTNEVHYSIEKGRAIKNSEFDIKDKSGTILASITTKNTTLARRKDYRLEDPNGVKMSQHKRKFPKKQVRAC